MRLKLDENLGARVAGLLREAGHDVATVFQESLAGAGAWRILDGASVCRLVHCGYGRRI